MFLVVGDRVARRAGRNLEAVYKRLGNWAPDAEHDRGLRLVLVPSGLAGNVIGLRPTTFLPSIECAKLGKRSYH